MHGDVTPEVIVPAETVFAVEPSVVSIFEPEILKLEPILVAVERAASTLSCTLEECLVTSPPAIAGDVIRSIPKAAIAFFI